ILSPEEEAAHNLVHLLDYGHPVESMKLDAEYYVIRFTIPQSFVNYTVADLQLEKNFELQVLAIQHHSTEKNIIGIASVQYQTIPYSPALMERLSAGDKLVCMGKYKNFQKLWTSI
ncbi:MAG: TrkA family potassium uptake protein, partial [Bacteroidales bacterium]|nr:TrkA family potassium uptake protein [Bacteroidales bacterium]